MKATNKLPRTYGLEIIKALRLVASYDVCPDTLKTTMSSFRADPGLPVFLAIARSEDPKVKYAKTSKMSLIVTTAMLKKVLEALRDDYQLNESGVCCTLFSLLDCIHYMEETGLNVLEFENCLAMQRISSDPLERPKLSTRYQENYWREYIKKAYPSLYNKVDSTNMSPYLVPQICAAEVNLL